jgi:hypothetical protein
MRASEAASPALTYPSGDISAPQAGVIRLVDELSFEAVRVASSLDAPDDCLTRRHALKRLWRM